MDYKKEIGNLLNEIQSEKFLKFLYNVIVSFKGIGFLCDSCCMFRIFDSLCIDFFCLCR